MHDNMITGIGASHYWIGDPANTETLVTYDAVMVNEFLHQQLLLFHSAMNRVHRMLASQHS